MRWFFSRPRSVSPRSRQPFRGRRISWSKGLHPPQGIFHGCRDAATGPRRIDPPERGNPAGSGTSPVDRLQPPAAYGTAVPEPAAFLVAGGAIPGGGKEITEDEKGDQQEPDQNAAVLPQNRQPGSRQIGHHPVSARPISFPCGSFPFRSPSCRPRRQPDVTRGTVERQGHFSVRMRFAKAFLSSISSFGIRSPNFVKKSAWLLIVLLQPSLSMAKRLPR